MKFISLTNGQDLDFHPANQDQTLLGSITLMVSLLVWSLLTSLPAEISWKTTSEITSGIL